MAGLTIHAVRTLHVGPASLEVAAGRCTALWGPSGSGKSLLLRALADLDPHEGEVRVGGEAQSSMRGPEWRRRVGYLPTESRWWAATVGEHFPAAAVVELDALGFEADVLGWEVARMSSGERQRLALLRLLTHGPEALLLDEPSANLDAESTARVEALVQRFRTERDAAVLWVGHDPEQRTRVAVAQFRIDAGRIEAC
jgi:ABC-type iron transport system FetAB ATPase subunit